MTARFKRQVLPRLIRRAERDLHLKFKRRPVLVVKPRVCRFGRSKISWKGSNKKRVEPGDPVTGTHVYLPRRMIRDYPRLAQAVAAHELREALLVQHGRGRLEAHRKAKSFEQKDLRDLHLSKRVVWLLKDYKKRRKEK